MSASGMKLAQKGPATSRYHRRSVQCFAAALPNQFKSLKPVGDRVLVKVDKETTKSQGGLLLPPSAQKKPTVGTIVALGETQWAKVGDRVLYSKFAGTEVEVQAEAHVLLKEEDVIGVMSSSEKITEMKPTVDRVLIKCAVAEDVSTGGVLLSAQQSDKPTFGEVVAVGPGRKAEDKEELLVPNVTVGSTVLYSKYTGTDLADEDDLPYIVVRETDIVAALS